VQDGEIVAAIVAGDPAGLAAAYDNYAPGLYAYCRTLLSEPADAADAVQDTYVIAAAKLDGLREPDRLRPWLYAVARNECYRRLRARGLSAPLDAAVEVTSDEPGVELDPEREELRYLVVDALSGLNPSDREVIELNLRHALDGEELADALGVSRNRAQTLVSRARSQFEGALGALLVARTSRECEELDDILAGWDGELSRKRVNRHIERCEVCRERKRRELSPAMLLSMLPMVALPAGLREQVLRLVDDVSPVSAGHRELVAHRAEPFDHSGFPKPVAAPRRVYGVQALTVAACVAAAAAILLGAGTFLTLDALHHKGAPTASAATVGPAAVSQAPLNSGSTPVSPSSPSPKGSGSGGKHIGLTIRVSGSPSASVSGSSGSPRGSTPGGGTSPTPGRTSQPPSPPPSPPPSSPGTLAVSAGVVTLTLNTDGSLSGSFTLTAQGGDVSGYSITDPSSGLSVSPTSGSLTSGESVTISLSAASVTSLASETDLTVSPGGQTVAVDVPGG
jgi:RNA polymerase sigma factor (sigma-70 family)